MVPKESFCLNPLHWAFSRTGNALCALLHKTFSTLSPYKAGAATEKAKMYHLSATKTVYKNETYDLLHVFDAILCLHCMPEKKL